MRISIWLILVAVFASLTKTVDAVPISFRIRGKLFGETRQLGGYTIPGNDFSEANVLATYLSQTAGEPIGAQTPFESIFTYDPEAYTQPPPGPWNYIYFGPYPTDSESNATTNFGASSLTAHSWRGRYSGGEFYHADLRLTGYIDPSLISTDWVQADFEFQLTRQNDEPWFENTRLPARISTCDLDLDSSWFQLSGFGTSSSAFLDGYITDIRRVSGPAVRFNQGDFANVPYLPGSITQFANGLASSDPLRNSLNQLVASNAINLGNKGCTVTSLAMAIRDLGLSTTVTPPSLYAELSSIQGFTPIEGVLSVNAAGVPLFMGGDVKWGDLQKLYPSLSWSGFGASRLSELAGAFACGSKTAALVCIDERRHHWVYADGYDPETQKFSIVDPNGGALTGWFTLDALKANKAILLTDQADNPARVGPYPRSAIVQTQSPVNLLITSPDGRRAGTDGAGASYSDLVGASSLKLLPSSDPGSEFSDQDLQVMNQNAPTVAFLSGLTAGEYKVDLYGIADGPYTVNFNWTNANGSQGGASFQGVVTTGQHLAFNVVVPADLQGDYDNDGDVDGSDFLVWQTQVGVSSGLIADGNMDMVVDDRDLKIWNVTFGQKDIAATLAIPEPQSSLLIALAAGVTLTVPTRRVIAATYSIQ